MAIARWNGTIIAQSDTFEKVEGNVYFPADALVAEHFESSDQTSSCFWKGKANYYDVVVDGQRNAGAAWYYAEPKAKAANIKGHVAFWRGVDVEE